MQLQWERMQIPAMGVAVREVQNQEQTLEVRLGEDMPDIGHIICGWGQPLLRGKDWHGDSMALSGGIMAWILYAPEDGTQPRCIEGWLPFQLKWNKQSDGPDGVIRCDVCLRGLDARVLSARKMMLRAQISALGEALEPRSTDFYSCAEVPQHIQLLKQSFPTMLMSEAAEVVIPVDEDVSISGAKPEKIISCTLQPKLSEQKVAGSRAIFRGECNVHLVYFGEDGIIYSRDLSVPFAQYAQLETDYDKQTTASAVMAVSSLEPELTQEGLRLKCSLICQYVILEQRMIEVARDAYSTSHEITPSMQEAVIPVVLDQRTERRTVNQSGPGEPMQIIDTCVFLEQPVCRRIGNQIDIQLPGSMQVLGRDENGQYHGNLIRFADQWSICAEENTTLQLVVAPADRPRAALSADGLETQCDMDIHICAAAEQTVPQISMIEVGQPLVLPPDRPSLILRRASDASLWDLAKCYGSTMDQIREANAIEDTPQKDKMLLIPIS